MRTESQAEFAPGQWLAGLLLSSLLHASSQQAGEHAGGVSLAGGAGLQEIEPAPASLPADEVITRVSLLVFLILVEEGTGRLSGVGCGVVRLEGSLKAATRSDPLKPPEKSQGLRLVLVRKRSFHN